MPKLSEIMAQQKTPQTMAAAAPAGLLAPGNIDLSKRPIVRNTDGSYSTVRSISVDQDGRSYLIPTVVNDQVVSNDDAIRHFQQTGENLGQFKTWQDADAYAKQLHDQQAAEYDQRAAAGTPARVKLSDLTNATPSSAPDTLPTMTVRAPDRLPGVLGTINDFGNDAGDALMHHLVNLPVGLGQLVAHGFEGSPIAKGIELGGNLAGQPGAGNAIHGFNQALDNAAAKREADYQEAVPTNTASVTGATIGEILPWLTGLGELRAAGLLPTATTKLGKLGALAAEGGAMGAAQPVTSGAEHEATLGDLITGEKSVPSYGSQKAQQIITGAAAAPAIAAVGAGAKGLIAGAQDILTRIRNPQTVADRYIADLFGKDPATLAKLQQAAQFVPSEVPTAAQAITGADAVKAERLLRNHPDAGVPFANADIANNQARQAVVSRLAGTPADMKAAIETRRANAAPFIESSLTPSTPAMRWGRAGNAIDNALSQPMTRDADFRALQEARTVVGKVRKGDLQEDDALEELTQLADSAGSKKAQLAFSSALDQINKNLVDPSGVLKTIATIRNGPLGVNPKVADGLDFLAKQIGASQNVRGLVGTDILDGVRQQTARLLGNAKGPIPGVGTQQGVALGPVKNQIVEAIDRVAPGYRDYVAKYRADSTPINTMASVGKLADPNAPGSLNAAGDPQLAMARLRQVLRGDDKAKFPMSSGARSELNKVLQSLERRTISDNKIAAAGPATAADMQAANSRLGSLIFGDPLANKPGALTRAAGIGIGSAVGHAIPIPGSGLLGAILGGALPEAVGGVNSRIASRIGETAASAPLTADAIQRVIAAQQQAGGQSVLSRLLFGAPAQQPQPSLGQAIRQALISGQQQGMTPHP